MGYRIINNRGCIIIIIIAGIHNNKQHGINDY